MANVKFEYLFLDIEWNQAPKTTDIEEREPVQIGIVAVDAKLNIKRTFSKSIRLSNREYFNPNTFTVSHYPLEAIMKSKSEETVLKNMNISFQNYKYIVVWTNETYELLKRRTDKYGISMPRHRVIILQQLLMQIAGDGKKVIGFEKSLKQAGIKYQKNYLHYSKHDVNYLYLLFCKCYGEYRKLTEQETCYLNPRTHKVHNGNCRYVDSALIKSSKDVIFQGNKVCKIGLPPFSMESKRCCTVNRTAPTGNIRLKLHTKHQITAFTKSFAPFSLSANKCCSFFVIPLPPFRPSTGRCAGNLPTWRYKHRAVQAGFRDCPVRQSSLRSGQ